MANEEIMAPLDLSGNDVDAQYDEDNEAPESAPGVDVEVVDDTPASDRGRAPLPDDVKQRLDDDDETEEYSHKVKQRIDQMKKAWHDERRAKEAALREREEAIRVAQTAYQERVAYQQRLQEGETWAIEQAKQRAALQLEQAKRAYREAYEAGDSERLVDAQQAMSTTTLEVDRLNQYRPQYALQSAQNAVYTQQQTEPERYVPPEPDSRTQEWGERNKWFGADDEMTSFALGVHKRLVDEGVSPNTDEYYERIDARMRTVFPDKFGSKKRQSSTVVAPVGRSPKGKKVVLTQTQVSLAKRLGITPEAYARELVKQQEM
jgi:hypothetical protein